MASALFSAPGVALATFLHTLGAIGYLAGIAFFIGWSRSLHRGHHAPSVLATGAALTYVSVAANLIGGFLRTYQPGHPSLTAIFTEPWVLLMAIKHVALFAGIFAAVWLFEIEAPRMRKALATGTLTEMPHFRPRAMAVTVVLSIVVAAVLGGVSAVVGIGPDEAADPIEDDGHGNMTAGPAGPYHFEGIVSTDPQGGVTSGTFDVPDGIVRIEARLVGVSGVPVNPAQYELTLRDATGAGTTGTTSGQDPAGPRQIDLSVGAPFAGQWTYEVRGTGIDARWTLDITLIPA